MVGANARFDSLQFTGGTFNTFVAKISPGRATSVVDEPQPQGFVLYQNYPNPFNPTTVISFQLPVASAVSLSIFNTNGQLIKQVAGGSFTSGRHSLVWDATNDRGERVASGVYVYLLKAGEFTAQRKLVLMK